MDLEFLVRRMSEEERECYLKTSATEYYHFLDNRPEFHTIIDKVENSIKLSEAEWSYIFTKLYLISCRALLEEGKLDFMDYVFYLLSKLGLKVAKKNQSLYYECYKMVQFVQSIQKGKEINVDLLNGIDYVMETSQESDLNILLQQYKEANIFRDNQDAYMKAYQDSISGEISVSERMYSHAFQNAYDREQILNKSLIKKLK